MGKIKFLRVVTNGTVIPNEEIMELSSLNNVYWLNSNYSIGKGNIVHNLLSERCKVYTAEGFEWVDLGVPGKSLNQEAKRNETFRTCFIRNCVAFVDGELFRCPRCYIVKNNKMLELEPHSHISFSTVENDIEKKLNEFYSLEQLVSCDFCNMKENRRIIPAAEQLSL